MNSITLFREKVASEVFEQYLATIKREITGKENDYILNINKSEWLEYFINRYNQTPLEIYPERITQALAGKGVKQVSNLWGSHLTETIRIEISLPYTGTSYLFHLRPSSYIINSCQADIEGHGTGSVIHTIELVEHDEQLFNSLKQNFINYINQNIASINKEAENFNRNIATIFNETYELRKQKVLNENSFFAKIGVMVNPDTKEIYQPPTLTKKRIPEPILDSAAPKEYTINPVFEDEHYQDILKIIYATFKAVEKKPSIYSVKDEEELRDYVLPILETRYESATVTGETFNKGGKTDILVRYKDNTNLFVAECKYWKGEAGFLETIDQLFDRYLTWRDSKAALIFFVENKEFSKVLLSIKAAAKKHAYFVRETGNHGESSFSYIFHFPTDKGKYIYTEIMAFHFPG